MKVWAISATLLLGSVSAAQATERTERDDDSRKSASPRYVVAPSFGVTTVMSEVVPSVGLRGAWGFGEIFALGVGVTALGFEEGRRGEQSLVYLGPSFSWTLRPRRRVHPAFQLLAGTGRHGWESGSQPAIAFEGAAGVEVDASSFMRVGLMGVARAGLVAHPHTLFDDRLSGLGARMSLSLGSF